MPPSASVTRDADSAACIAGLPPAGEVTWFKDNVHAHEAQLKSYLKLQYPGDPDVDDIVQESYVRVWKARASQKFECVRAFLFRVAQNVARDRYRSKSRRLEVGVDDLWRADVEDEGVDVRQAVSEREKEELLAAALAELPARGYEVVILCKLQGLSHADAARRLGISARTVDEHLRRGMKRLGQELRKRGAAEEVQP
jgi:RNA polymerase sigma factor (sigma-70 family)